MTLKTKHLIILFLLGIAAFFVHNKVIFADIMESRNIITAREMVYDGHWIVPTMNGELRLEKPPLPTWIAAGAELISPDNIGMQRAMAGLAALLLVYFFYCLGEELTKRKDYAFISSLMLMTSYNMVLMGRTASWDIYCHAFMLGGIYFMIRSLRREGPQWGGFLAAGLFMGLSFMSKGPVSFYALLLPALLTLPILGDIRGHRKLGSIFTMILITLVIGGWWYVLLTTFHTEEWNYVMNKETGAWVNRNVRPWHYYSTFFLETGVWSLMLITAIITPVVISKARRVPRTTWYVIAWLLGQIVLLSFLPEKKKRYLLPILMPAAYAMGALVTFWMEKFKLSRLGKGHRLLYKINAYLIALVVAALPILGYVFLVRPGLVPLWQVAVLGILIWVVAVYLFKSAKQEQPERLIYGVAGLFLIVECFMMPYVGKLVNNPEFRSIGETRHIEALKPLPYLAMPNKPVRIEFVYEMHKEIHNLPDATVETLKARAPFVLMTQNPLADELPDSVINQFNCEYIGFYDNNRRPRSDKHHSKAFEYHITVIRNK